MLVRAGYVQSDIFFRPVSGKVYRGYYLLPVSKSRSKSKTGKWFTVGEEQGYCVPAFCPACGSEFGKDRAEPECKIPVGAVP